MAVVCKVNISNVNCARATTFLFDPFVTKYRRDGERKCSDPGWTERYNEQISPKPWRYGMHALAHIITFHIFMSIYLLVRAIKSSQIRLLQAMQVFTAKLCIVTELISVMTFLSQWLAFGIQRRSNINVNNPVHPLGNPVTADILWSQISFSRIQLLNIHDIYFNVTRFAFWYDRSNDCFYFTHGILNCGK